MGRLCIGGQCHGTWPTVKATVAQGIGVQSPNCCVDGWDFGWRADVLLLPNGSLMISGSSWETCDGNANCGGYFWEHLWYHSQTTLNPQNISTPIYLRMQWEPVTVD